MLSKCCPTTQNANRSPRGNKGWSSLPHSLRLFKGTNGEPLIQWTLSRRAAFIWEHQATPPWIWTRILRNTFTNDLIPFFILSLSISQPPCVDASLLMRRFNWSLRSTDGPLRTWEENRREGRSTGALHHSDLSIIRQRKQIQKLMDLLSLGCSLQVRFKVQVIKCKSNKGFVCLSMSVLRATRWELTAIYRLNIK